MDLSIIFEDNLTITVPIESGNESHNLEFVFSKPNDLQTLEVLRSIEEPDKLTKFADEFDENSEKLPNKDEIATIIKTQEAMYKLMDDLVVSAPLYDEKKHKSFARDYFSKLEKSIRDKVYTDFMSVAVGGNQGDAAKKFIISDNTTMPLLEAEK